MECIKYLAVKRLSLNRINQNLLKRNQIHSFRRLRSLLKVNCTVNPGLFHTYQTEHGRYYGHRQNTHSLNILWQFSIALFGCQVSSNQHQYFLESLFSLGVCFPRFSFNKINESPLPKLPLIRPS